MSNPSEHFYSSFYLHLLVYTRVDVFWAKILSIKMFCFHGEHSKISCE